MGDDDKWTFFIFLCKNMFEAIRNTQGVNRNISVVSIARRDGVDAIMVGPLADSALVGLPPSIMIL